MSKIFGIGLPKTGTSSLNQALIELGVSSQHDSSILEPLVRANQRAGRRLLEGIEETAICDMPVACYLETLDKQYPGSKFILTIREGGEWDKSWLRTYGPYRFQRSIETQQEHIGRAVLYFKDRPGDLLIYDLCGGAGWEPLCDFLRVPIPDKPFPRENVNQPPAEKNFAKRTGHVFKIRRD